MHDGWGFVLATYLLVAATLVIWFWMILGKLARAKRRQAATVSGEGAQALAADTQSETRPETPRG